MAIPNHVHFVWGLKDEPEPFHLVHYVCVESCRRVQRPERIFVHCGHPPTGPYWERLERDVTVLPAAQVPAVSAHADERLVPPEFRYAHHSDFVRLDALIEHGGIYADLDTLFVAPLSAGLLAEKFVLGREGDIVDELAGVSRPSLCNALLASEPRAAFAVAWRTAMPHALNGTWSNHSTLLPYELSESLPNQVHVEPSRSFYAFAATRGGIRALLEELHTDLDGVLTLHLWAHLWWREDRRDFSDVHAGLITEDFVRHVDTTYTVLAREFLPA
jgi:Glycosyltransferase sugar-binding region containing DXD motif